MGNRCLGRSLNSRRISASVADEGFRRLRMSMILALEALQWRAALSLDEYRKALLAHPDAVELPIEHVAQGRTVVAERDSVLGGFAVVLPRGDGDADLDGLFVEPAMWRQGIGSRLVQAAASLAASGGAKYLHVVAHPGALAFYAACGFVPVGETQTRFGIGLAMSKPIRPRARNSRDDHRATAPPSGAFPSGIREPLRPRFLCVDPPKCELHRV